MCKNNPKIEAIGFSIEDNYAITKDFFDDHITGDITKDLGRETVFKNLKIIRPVTANNLKDKWTLADVGTNDGQNYIMEDARFQSKTLDGNFLKQNSNDDEIIAQVEYSVIMKNGEEKQKDRKVLKVYTLNGKRFEGRTIPDNIIINKPQKIIEKKEQYIQPSLFDQLNSNEEENNA